MRPISLLLCFVLLISYVLCIRCGAIEPLPSTDKAQSVYLYNLENDKVIINKSSEERIYPASMAKITAGLVAIDLVGSRLDETVTVTRDMLTGAQGATIGIRAGEVYTFQDLLYASVCGGFNDATLVLAGAGAGSVSQFVHLMNEKASSLGAIDTHYTNPTGWHDENMYTTLGDTAKICLEAAKNELYMTVSSAVKYTSKDTSTNDPFTVNNRNGLIGTYYALGYYSRYANGLMAGMTDEGGYCVASIAENEGLSYLCIVMGASSESDRIYSYEIAKDLISYAVSYYGYLDVLKAGDKICAVPLEHTVSDSDSTDYMLSCTVKDDITLFIPYDKNSIETLEVRHYVFDEPIYAPVNEGDIIGGVDIYVDGKLCGSAPLCAGESVSANSFLVAMARAKDFITGRFFIISMIIFFSLLAVYYYYAELRSRKKKSKNIKFNDIY